MHLVLFQPEIPQNMGTLMRFAACMDLFLDVIEPCGFLLADKHLKRAGMDYRDKAKLSRFPSWQAFCKERKGLRRIAVTTTASQGCYDFVFDSSDVLIMGQESCGLPPHILRDCHKAVTIPMAPSLRSLNLALAAAIVTAEALRQTHQLPGASSS